MLPLGSWSSGCEARLVSVLVHDLMAMSPGHQRSPSALRRSAGGCCACWDVPDAAGRDGARRRIVPINGGTVGYLLASLMLEIDRPLGWHA